MINNNNNNDNNKNVLHHTLSLLLLDGLLAAPRILDGLLFLVLRGELHQPFLHVVIAEAQLHLLRVADQERFIVHVVLWGPHIVDHDLGHAHFRPFSDEDRMQRLLRWWGVLQSDRLGLTLRLLAHFCERGALLVLLCFTRFPLFLFPLT